MVVQRPSILMIGRVMRPPPPKLPDFIRRGMQHVIDQQNEYWRELKVNPESFYALAEFMDLMDSILASQGKTEKPQIVPDEAYVRQCLGPHVVEMPEYTIADSTKLAHINKDDPLAFLIAGKIFYEGKRLPLPEEADAGDRHPCPLPLDRKLAGFAARRSKGHVCRRRRIRDRRAPNWSGQTVSDS